MDETLSPAVTKEKTFHDDLTFTPELYSDIFNPPLQSQLGRLEIALNVLARNKKMSSRAVSKRVWKQNKNPESYGKKKLKFTFLLYIKITWNKIDDQHYFGEKA